MIINVEQLSKTANGLIFETQPVQIGLGLIATGKKLPTKKIIHC